jgi:DNA modification methylase
MTAPQIMMPECRILVGDCRQILATLPSESVHCCVTSPPYFGLRNYGHAGQIGLERTPDEYVAELVAVFREVRRVLREDGVLWMNLGDSYAAARGGSHQPAETLAGAVGGKTENGERVNRGRENGYNPTRNAPAMGLKHKDLIGIPWRVAFALQADGWWLRSDIIWHKPNVMPESVTDRCTKAHEYIFMLTKAERYYYDHEAIKEPCVWDIDGSGTEKRKERQQESFKSHPDGMRAGIRRTDKQRGHSRRHDGFNDRWDQMEKTEQCSGMRNKRDVWTVSPANYPEAHFATYPPELIKPCVLAGCPKGGTVLDPFFGSGTTGQVALELGRSCIGVELNPEYAALAKTRVENVTPAML